MSVYKRAFDYFKQTPQKVLIADFNKYAQCPVCKGIGEITTKQNEEMIKSHQADIVRAKLDELEKARTYLNSDYYWKRFNELSVSKEAHEYLEGKEELHNE